MYNSKTTIIAEAGVNHNGDMNLALKLIDVAADAGADIVKFQTFSAKHLASIDAPKAAYQQKNTGTEESQFEMLKKLELTHDQHFLLKAHCEKRNIHFLSTPFEISSTDFLLQQMKLTTIKIPSGELTTAPLLLRIATYKPNIILSTGMATVSEIEAALAVIAFGLLGSTEKPSQKAFLSAYYSAEGQKKLKEKVTLLHCTSDYPAQFEDIHLRAIDTLRTVFDLPIGYSDHSMGIAVSIAAVARGASMIEKHFTVDRQLPGPDHIASLEPTELKQMVKSIREVELALGSGVKKPAPPEYHTKLIARKSLIAEKPIIRGEKFSENNLNMKRPGSGISPFLYWDYLEKTATRDYKTDELIDE